MISLFAGCGGSSLGYAMAGFRELAAVEWEGHAAAVFRANFPGVFLYENDVTRLDPEAVMGRAALLEGELSVLDASPPCQGFSHAGRRDAHDERNELFREVARFARAMRPRAVVMENVAAMGQGANRATYARALGSLKDAGYRARGWVLDAANFGVPQTRARLITIAIRGDLQVEPSPPPPTVPRPYTIGEALRRYPAGVTGNHTELTKSVWARSEPGQASRKVDPAMGAYDRVRLDPARPCPTIVRQHRHFRWDVCRQLSNEETLAAFGYPPEFLLEGSLSQVNARLGNSVPPLLMRAIAEHVASLIG